MRPEWLKDEYKFAIFRENEDDEDDFFETYKKTEAEAKEYCESEIAAYGNKPDFQFYYKEV